MFHAGRFTGFMTKWQREENGYSGKDGEYEIEERLTKSARYEKKDDGKEHAYKKAEDRNKKGAQNVNAKDHGKMGENENANANTYNNNEKVEIDEGKEGEGDEKAENDKEHVETKKDDNEVHNENKGENGSGSKNENEDEGGDETENGNENKQKGEREGESEDDQSDEERKEGNIQEKAENSTREALEYEENLTEESNGIDSMLEDPQDLEDQSSPIPDNQSPTAPAITRTDVKTAVPSLKQNAQYKATTSKMSDEMEGIECTSSIPSDNGVKASATSINSVSSKRKREDDDNELRELRATEKRCGTGPQRSVDRGDEDAQKTEKRGEHRGQKSEEHGDKDTQKPEKNNYNNARRSIRLVVLQELFMEPGEYAWGKRRRLINKCAKEWRNGYY
ncbi:hypothetical protein P154DRAFT_577906 [Amniculicola lignicola CBS 123094]|uniref:Uncharacterized protein n=1 Tax=Amniculicola lignicola CBS 123094 TaxID=1392246 RepID=A0A6A5WA50_9PLEO|nr:hypothetical protein P154DRAFT_577906 [Amniculicola lignicola CBS 123094]